MLGSQCQFELDRRLHWCLLDSAITAILKKYQGDITSTKTRFMSANSNVSFEYRRNLIFTLAGSELEL